MLFVPFCGFVILLRGCFHTSRSLWFFTHGQRTGHIQSLVLTASPNDDVIRVNGTLPNVPQDDRERASYLLEKVSSMKPECALASSMERPATPVATQSCTFW